MKGFKQFIWFILVPVMLVGAGILVGILSKAVMGR